MSIFGRTFPSFAADYIDRFNVITAMTHPSGILVVALWLSSTSPLPVVLFNAFHGLASGAFVGMVPAIVAQISGLKTVGLRNSMVFAFCSAAGLVGNPVAGAMRWVSWKVVTKT